MKRLFTLAAAATAVCMANAADYTVYDNGVLAGGLNVYNWWQGGMDFAAANPTDADAKAFKFYVADGGEAGSMGILTNAEGVATGTLNTATLNFKWYATGTGKYTVRLTATNGSEQNYSWDVTADNAGKWQTVALSVPVDFPGVAADWKNYVGKGEGYIFSVIAESASTDAAIYFDNIYYSDIDESWSAPETPEIVPPATVPVPTRDAADVISLFSSEYTPATTFGIGSWGQSTVASIETIDGSEVYMLKNYNYLGWELQGTLDVEGYDYMHVDFYPCEETTFGFTPISQGAEKGWVAPEVRINEWNSYDAPLSYFDNVNLAELFQVKFDQGKGVQCYLANVYFWKNNGETPDPVPGNGAKYKGTISDTCEQTMDGVTTQYPYTVNYTITYNEDRTISVEATYTWHNGEPVGLIGGTLFINNEPTDFTLTDGVRTATTTATYEEGETLAMNFYLPMALGVVSTPVTYVVGTSSEDTSVDSIAADNTPVEYFNLQGMRVANPEHGIFIRRQGNTATKVIF